MKTQLQTVNFNNQSLITFEQNGMYYTAMKPICENIGLDWTAQAQRLKRDEILNSTMVVITIVANDGKDRQMVCLPIQYLNGWLFGIDVKRVKPEIRETLIRYKKECYQVLFDYWNGKRHPQQLALPNPEQYSLRIQDSEEFLALFIKMYGYCFQAHEMQEKLRNTRLGRDIDDTIGGYYLYNFHRPLEQLMKKAKSYIHANTERLALVKAINQLLS